MKQLKFTIFELGSFAWIITAIFALILAVAKIFFLELLILWLVVLSIVMIVLITKKWLVVTAMPRFDLCVLAGLIVLGIALSVFTTPTIFGGRDEGSFATSALMIADSHSLDYSNILVEEFFKIYGKGKALNFPGFYYTPEGLLHSQFLPGYSSWTAIFAQLFGIKGLQPVNFFPFITFLFSLYLIAKNYSRSKKFPAIGVALFASLLPITLFYKFTLTELFFGALIWFSLYLLVKYLKDKTRINFIVIFIPLALTPFVRIESIGIIFTLFLLLTFLDYKHIRFPRYQALFAILGFIIAASLIINAHFFVDTFKNFAVISPIESISKHEMSLVSFVPDDWKNWYMIKIFHVYNIVPLFIMGITCIVTLLRRKRWFRLVPFFFFSSTFIYVIDANISLDHPWMLRRFIFSIIPVLVLYSMIFMEVVHSRFRFLSWSIITALFMLNAIMAIPFFIQSQNKELLHQIEPLALQFEQNDLVLVSQNAAGSSWSLISEPLRTVYGKRAIYFFNPEDYDKIDKSRFNKIYLIASADELDHYASLQKKIVSEYSINNGIVHPSTDPLERPAMRIYQTKGQIHLLQKE
ncbi:MAG: hypothetical protein U9M90_04950 [Patescibacteria group bacterium]|nr:hypothetical protein [Patescibacteria group bacterium]